MSTRERWIVYPLLFLTLGIAMRNQFLPTKRMGAVDFMAGELSAQTIHCNNLEVMQDGLSSWLNPSSSQTAIDGYRCASIELHPISVRL